MQLDAETLRTSTKWPLVPRDPGCAVAETTGTDGNAGVNVNVACPLDPVPAVPENVRRADTNLVKFPDVDKMPPKR